jgi:hypothetical protein
MSFSCSHSNIITEMPPVHTRRCSNIYTSKRWICGCIQSWSTSYEPSESYHFCDRPCIDLWIINDSITHLTYTACSLSCNDGNRYLRKIANTEFVRNRNKIYNRRVICKYSKESIPLNFRNIVVQRWTEWKTYTCVCGNWCTRWINKPVYTNWWDFNLFLIELSIDLVFW